ncbi:hypothetical protein [Nitrobacter sp. JJSN]|uniref:hypothetical protein n=1 Tax=Nitrobacter sp. JJSN TaxID=3453033 RepID=UPI003F75FC9C
MHKFRRDVDHELRVLQLRDKLLLRVADNHDARLRGVAGPNAVCRIGRSVWAIEVEQSTEAELS